MDGYLVVKLSGIHVEAISSFVLGITIVAAAAHDSILISES